MSHHDEAVRTTKRPFASAVTVFALIVLSVFLMAASTARAQAPIDLGTAASFAVLGGSTVTNTGSDRGDRGPWSESRFRGHWISARLVNGTIHAADAAAAQAQSDLTIAYNTAAGQACDVDLTGQDLGGLTLTAGAYCFSSSAQLTGTVTLNAQGNTSAVFIFQIGSTLTTASTSRVNLINGAQACNVFWQVGSSATLGTGTAFKGNILALTSITLTTGATIVNGRALARNGAVTLDTNTITRATCRGPTTAADQRRRRPGPADADQRPADADQRPRRRRPRRRARRRRPAPARRRRPAPRRRRPAPPPTPTSAPPTPTSAPPTPTSARRRRRRRRPAPRRRRPAPRRRRPAPADADHAASDTAADLDAAGLR